MLRFTKKNLWKKNFYTHLDNFFDTWTNFLTMIVIFIGKKQKIWKSTLLHCFFSVFKKLYLYNLLFLRFLIEKMAASDHSEVSAYGLDLKKNLSSHYKNLKTLEKKQIILGQFFFTPWEDNAWRKVPFFTSLIHQYEERKNPVFLYFITYRFEANIFIIITTYFRMEKLIGSIKL